MIAPSASAIEAAFREYISNYDGTQKDFSSEVEPLFDALYHEDFTIQYKDTTSYESTDEDLYYGKTIDRNAVKDLHISSLSDGVKYTIVHFYSKRIACNCIDVLLCGEKEGEETFTFRVVYRIEGDKLAEAVVVDDDCTIVSCRVHLVPLPSSCVPLQLIKSIIEPNKRDNKAATYASATYNRANKIT